MLSPSDVTPHARATHHPTRIEIRREKPCDIAARDHLLDAAFGPDRFTKSSERLREGRVPARGLALAAFEDGDLIGTVRLWSVMAGNVTRCLLLGPLAVDECVRKRGVGAVLMWRALRAARTRGYRAVLLVGDPAYYARFGFSACNTRNLRMPGPYDYDRLQACEFVPGVLRRAHGMIAPNLPARVRLSRIMHDMIGDGPAILQPA
ncbi:MAG: N-acetyltransferase [Bradyrhizobium sp.]